MPVGKQIGSYSGAFSYVRYPAEGVVEGSYTGTVKGDLAGTATGTMTFCGDFDRGTVSDLGAGYLKSGGVVPYKGQGVYWSTSQGNWETRAAVMVDGNPCVVEGQIKMKDGTFTMSGKLFELT
ncbi:MAG: hypothetical protein H6977_11835 [Gammaproteobacteria bacterium]|nr:hypothetical protein [Gammaproteobacteria bacterium]MCP5200696.1 hypothetical protein [Gammaproteobacteria bacterium]